MINLKELEETLDKALANETYESVMAWFAERDKEKIQSYIGVNGYLSNLQMIHDNQTKSKAQNFLETGIEVSYSKSDIFPLAA
jgi:hypothetical protein